VDPHRYLTFLSELVHINFMLIAAYALGAWFAASIVVCSLLGLFFAGAKAGLRRVPGQQLAGSASRFAAGRRRQLATVDGAELGWPKAA
jgi:hypothetical protein